MIVPTTESVTGTAVSINPAFVVSMRPDPADVDGVTIIKLQDGETVHVVGEHREVADELARTP